jgi:hypothetical protein
MFDDMLDELLSGGGGPLAGEEEMDELPDSVAQVHCPYCGEPSEVLLDPGGGPDQAYVEDCQVCCRPWSVRVRWYGGEASVEVHTEDEAPF